MALPTTNLDNKTFDEFLQEALAAIPVYAPDWTDHNVHDPGITLIELFAWLMEMQLYRLNTINDRHYRKFLKLLGIKPKPAAPSSVEVSFTLPDVSPVRISDQTVVSVLDDQTGNEIFFETRQAMPLTVGPARLVRVLGQKNSNPFDDFTSANQNPYAFFAPFGENPQDGDKLFFGFSGDLFDGNIPGPQNINLAFYLKGEEVIADDQPSIGDYTKQANLQWQYLSKGVWKNIEGALDETGGLIRNGKVWLPLSEYISSKDMDGKGEFHWLRVELEDPDYFILPQLKTVRLNTVTAGQQSSEIKESFSGSGLPHQTVRCGQVPALAGSLMVTIAGKAWECREDFDASGPGDSHYTVNYAQGSITFGDGLRGKIPPAGDNIVAVSYRTGGGNQGNVKAHSVNRIQEHLSGKVLPDNPEPGAGGKDAETMDQALARLRRELKSITRAVTSADYEYLALHMPGKPVARVKALPGYHPAQDRLVPGIVSVIAVPRLWKPDTGKPYQSFIRAVFEFLNPYRLLATEMFVLIPRGVKVSVKTTVVVKPSHLISDVRLRVQGELESYLNPLKGGMVRQGWPFGRPVYLSELYEVIDCVEGVDFVGKLELRQNDNENWQANTIQIPAHELVFSGEHEVDAEE
jgi:hypothetical protein